MSLDQEKIAELLPDNTSNLITPENLRDSFAEVGTAYDGLSFDYAGHAHDLVRVNATEDGLEAVDPLDVFGDGEMIPVSFPTDSPNFDSFDRLRVSNPETIFDSKQCFDNAPLLFDDQEVSGSDTTSVHSVDTASTVIGVAATTAGKRVRQTFMWFNYQPGKSHLVFLTGVLNKSGGGSGIQSGFGYYNDENGFFLQNDEGTVKLVRRSSTSGSAVDEKVAQTSWNIDEMDGTGPSGATLDFTKTQILIFDFEWLGVGRCRMGFVIDGIIYYAHQFVHSNILSAVYMSSPNLPIRYEIENLGAGAISTLEHICASVVSEGGSDKNGVLHHIDSDSLSSLSIGTSYAFLGGRLKSGYLGASVLVENVSMIVLSNDSCAWHFMVGATVAGTFTFVDHPNSAVQIAIGSSSNTVTGGIQIDGGFFTQELAAQFQTPNALRLGSAIDGTQQEWALVCEPLTNNVTVKAAVTWRELL